MNATKARALNPEPLRAGSVIEGGFRGQAALPSREPATFLSHIPNKSVPAFANWNWVLKRLTEAP
jgi:hypothetical protein